MTNEEKATLIWKAVFEDLYGRYGFDGWWDDINKGIKKEIAKEVTAVIAKVLTNDTGTQPASSH